MVLQIEYGNETEVIKSNIVRGVIKSRLPVIVEGFFRQDQYRWGKLYILSGKDKKLIRQF